MSQLNSILSLFEITDKNIIVKQISTKISPSGLHIHTINANLINDPIRCPHCGFKTLSNNGIHLSHIRLCTLNDGRYQLNLNKQRYLCHNCRETYGAFVQTNFTFSNNIKQQMVTLAKRTN
ncbi:transposase family protein [Lapidilactobacillus dextrinicus]|uniref:transposase family protein n=1 Tax=Lapidilactobacillus dextrinicus TaxID=51664 RepID=UPI003F28F321